VGRSTLALLAAAAALAAGCGGNASDRQKVDDFVKAANAVQERSGPAFDRANRAYISFSKGQLASGKAQAELAAGEKAMRQTRDEIAALTAPPQARELKRRLIALYDADAALAHESTLLAVFVPASAKAVRPLPGTGRRLTRDLRSAKTANAQIAALQRYTVGIGRVIEALQPLHPPPLLLERHHAEVKHLTAVRSLAQRLVRALKAQDSKRVAALLLRFRKLNSSAAAGPLPSDALSAYNRRYLGVRRALAAVERERTRLERTLK
jgi:hypothetical protein